MDLSLLEPKNVWKHFLDICAVPHPSHHEQALAAAVLAWAKAKGYEADQDDAGNVVVRKPAKAGREGCPGVIFQCHLDMVPQAAAGSGHDFKKDPIRPRLAPDAPGWLVASGTTLGADNGIGMALAMALFEDDALSHGPLEILFTVNEEDGMTGAKALKPGMLQGSVLLNIDGEEQNELTVGCAGSIRTLATLSHPAQEPPAGMAWHRVELGGLLGGHSGVDIDKGRANACIALARVLSRCSQGIGIAAFEGGSASNAIPRDASAIVGVARDREADFLSALQREADALRKELGESDPGMSISASGSPVPAAALAPVPSQDFLAMLAGMPNGLFSMEADMPGLVRSSSNLGTLKAAAADGYFKADTLVMVRSSSDEEKERYAAEAETRIQGMEGSGWKVGQHRAAVSPAWSPNMASPLLALAKDVYRETHGDWPLVKSTHGGLECGVFRPIFPHWDMISLGPDIRYPHSPDERVRVESVGIVYAFLKGLVERLQ